MIIEDKDIEDVTHLFNKIQGIKEPVTGDYSFLYKGQGKEVFVNICLRNFKGLSSFIESNHLWTKSKFLANQHLDYKLTGLKITIIYKKVYSPTSPPPQYYFYLERGVSETTFLRKLYNYLIIRKLI